MKKILCIDGGGIKGAFAASFLKTIEETNNKSIVDYFDLIVGTSTGGIIALGLGLGLPASEMLSFYEYHGKRIFRRSLPLVAAIRHFLIAKYSDRELKDSLQEVFGERRLGESKCRLVIPSANLDTGEVHVYKTSHHPRFERDYKELAVEVALATSAAPTYFPEHLTRAGTPLIDGGIWANNPLTVAAVEALGVLKWPADDIRVLSIGCTTTPFDRGRLSRHLVGRLGWATKIADLFMV
jgi:patatin-like phospholipase/acyl hydrolase